MNDTETNPQRHGAPDQEPSHRSADASRDDQPARDAADATAQLRSEASPGAAAPPVADGERPTGPIPPAYPRHLAAPQYPPTGQYPAPPQYPAASQYPAAPQYPAASQYPAAPQYPGASGQQAAADQGGWHRPADTGWQPDQQYPGQQYPGQQPWQQDGVEGVPPSSTDQMPPWATPVGAGPVAQPPRGNGRKVLAVGLAAVLLALGAGGAGAWVALEYAGQGGGPATTTSANSEVTRVVDRSSLAEIAKKAQSSVVSISTGRGEGSGVVLNTDGFVLSNNHVVSSSQNGSVKVAFSDGKSAAAKIIGTDPRTDLAVVKVEGMTGLTPAVLGDSAAMEVGDTVLALGSPLGLEGSVTAGIVSAKDRTIQASAEGQPSNPLDPPQQAQAVSSISGLLQTDAPINPGNSGGALVNTNAEVIGINTAIATSGQSTGNIGVGFAIPSNKAKAVADALMNGRKVSHPYLGVSLSPTSANGAVVASVAANGPAAKAGLREADVITQLNGKPVNDSDDVIAAVQGGTVGQQMAITYTRNGQEASVSATLADMP